MNRLTVLFLQISLFVITVASNETGGFTNRLPESILPVHYDLFLRINLGDDDFDGNVTILLNATEPTSTIILHSKSLSISSTNLISTESKASIPILKSYAFEEYEYWVSELYEVIEVGLYEISLEFAARLSNASHGLYQVSYSEGDSEERKLVIAAEFEPSAARTAFPCFDEPHLKATYKVSIQHSHNDGYYALSNMDMETVKRYDNFSVTTFKESIKMSTYLLTFVVTNFEGQSVMVDTKGVGDPFKLTIYGEQKWRNETKFSLKIAKAAVEFLIEYFDEAFQISKLDMIGIPRKGHPATETWGLIVFSAPYLFGQSDDFNRATTAYCIAHELAHQWFGNLVTMKWWDNLWLNEGFATFMGFKTISSIEPELEIEKYVWDDYIETTLKMDSIATRHPIIQHVTDTKAKKRIFDLTTYVKAGSVISMLESYVGEDNFRQAIRNYIKKFAYENVEASDLMDEVQSVAPEKDVRTFLQAWTEKPGYPVVNVEKAENGSFKLTQSCYTSSAYFKDGEFSGYRAERDESETPCNGSWPIPLTYVTDQGEIREPFLLTSDVEGEYFIPSNPKWVKLNSRWTGFYRVNYSRALWSEFSQMLSDNSSVLSYIDRCQLLRDALDLTQSDRLEFDVLLELFMFLQNEDDPSLWQHVLKYFLSFQKILNAEELAGFKAHFRLITDSYVEKHPTVFSDLSSKRLAPLISVACYVSNEQCVQAAKKYLESCIEKRSFEELFNLPLNGRKAAINSLPPETWLDLWELCKKNWDNGLCETLAETNNLPLLLKLLDEIVRLENVADSDCFFTFEAAAATNFTVIWKYIHDNFEDLRAARPAFDSTVVSGIAKYCFVEEEHLAQLKALIDKYPTDSKEQETIQQENLQDAEELLKVNKKHRKLVRRYLMKEP